MDSGESQESSRCHQTDVNHIHHNRCLKAQQYPQFTLANDKVYIQEAGNQQQFAICDWKMTKSVKIGN